MDDATLRQHLHNAFIYCPQTGKFLNRKTGFTLNQSPAYTFCYLQISVPVGGGGRRQLAAHRAAWLMMNGWLPPDDHVIDHINGNRHDNRMSNLRCISKNENGKMQRYAGVLAKPGYRGAIVNDYFVDSRYPVLVPRGESCYTSLRW